jgi:hypothetical protein
MTIAISGNGTITGIASGGVPAGTVTVDTLASTLNLASKTLTLPAGMANKVLAMTKVVDSNTTVSFSGVGGTQLGSLDFYYPVNVRIGGSHTKVSSTSRLVVHGWYHTWADSNFHDTWMWRSGDENNAKHLGVDPYAQSGEDGPSARKNYGYAYSVIFEGLATGSHTFYLASGAGDTRSWTGELNPNNSGRNPDTSNAATFSQMFVTEIEV